MQMLILLQAIQFLLTVVHHMFVYLLLMQPQLLLQQHLLLTQPILHQFCVNGNILVTLVLLQALQIMYLIRMVVKMKCTLLLLMKMVNLLVLLTQYWKNMLSFLRHLMLLTMMVLQTTIKQLSIHNHSMRGGQVIYLVALIGEILLLVLLSQI